MLIVGTIPNKDLPLTVGKVSLEGDFLAVNGRRFACTQGTGALITAALVTTEYLKLEPPHALVIGDIGGISDKGTREIYQYLIDKVCVLLPKVLVLHYCLPIMPLMQKLCQKIDSCSQRPFMIADAGAMYAAKGAGLAQKFDIFTPDVTEMGFLADPEAAHPAYAARHLFDCEPEKIPDLIDIAYKDKNAAKLLLVKGKIDYIAAEGKILARVDEPDVPALEAIGGTGDTVAGIVSALIYADFKPQEAAVVAAKVNRVAGQLARATPATKVKKIIDQFPAILKEYLPDPKVVAKD